MLKKSLLMAAVVLAIQAAGLFAGVEWQSKITDTVKGKAKITLVHTYAQAGNVRQDFVDVKTDANPFMKEGSYWLYKGESDKVMVVDSQEKTYMEVPLESLTQMAGAMGQIVKMTITEPKVEAVAKGKETVAGYECDHLQINSSYKMETKIAFMKMQTAVEQSQELWATKAIDIKELAASFKRKSFRTGFTDLDVLMEKQMQAYKDLGFTVKSITTTKNTDNKGKSEVNVQQMDVTEVTSKNLDASLFEIPAGFTRQEFFLPGTAK